MMENEQPLKIGEHVYIDGTIVHGFVHAPKRNPGRCMFDDVITITIPSDRVIRVTRPTPPPMEKGNAWIESWLENALAYDQFMDGGDDEVVSWINDANESYTVPPKKEVVS